MTCYIFNSLLFLCFIGSVLCQGHHGGQTVSCYNCDGQNFPSCLSNAHTCQHSHVCEIIYGAGHPVKIMCKPGHQCRHEINRGSGHCGVHGVNTVHGCEICCSDETCIKTQVEYLQKMQTASTPTVPMTTDVSGTAATGKVATGTFAMSTLDMSTDSMSTDSMTTDSTYAVGTMTTPHHMNPLLNGNCQDLMPNNGCAALGTSACQTDVGVRVCADSCGLCSLIGSRFPNKTICVDKLVTNECALLVQTNNICSNSLAEITCARTCGKCGSILDKLVLEILHPTTTTSTTTTTHAACVDTLQGMDCSALDKVCSNSLGPQICKKFCGLCTAS